jgi:PTS system nitrogen regulatory IIA component
MELKNVLGIHRIDLNAHVNTKKRALELVTECCATMMERADFFHALVEREKLGSTGLGHGVALPHARLAHLHTPMACFFKLEKPVDYEAIDQEPVDLIIGLFVPEEAREGHLQLLSQIAQLMSQESVRAALRQCHQVHEALRILTEPFGEQALVS